MDGNLFGMVVPRRKSAAQASQAFADQLDSSDGDSQLGGSDGEAKKKKKASKKGTPSRRGKLQTYGKRGRPKGAALTNSTSLPAKLELVLPEAKSSPRAPKSKPKPIVQRTRSPSMLSSTLMKPNAGSPVPVGAEESDIQPKPSDKDFLLRSTSLPGRVRKRVKISHYDPSLSDVLSDLTSLSHSVGPSSSDSEVEILAFTPVIAPSKPAGDTSTQVASNHGLKGREEPKWTSQILGSYIWVLIEPTTGRVIDPNKDQSQDEYRMWWPGKITSSRPTDIPLRVKLFGQKSAVIHEPSEENIASKLDALGRWRYQSPIFVSTPLRHIHSSAKKKLGNEREGLDQHRCKELEGRWKDAVIEMKQAEEAEQDSDYLPDVGEISSWPTSGLSLSQSSSNPVKVDGRSKRKGKRKRNELSDDEDPEHRDWEPPPPDDNLQIPGELVLARENPGKGASAIHNVVHWPAKILAYKTPKDPKQRPKYLVKWLDGTEGEILRPCFYTADEEEFSTCKLGIFESSVADIDNDDDKESLEVFKARWDFSRRSPSPEAVEPPPSMEDFRQLSIRVRFGYTKPVLSAILNKGYEPVMELHQSFMAGGQKRAQLLDHSSRRGHMDRQEVSELANYLKEWCLRPTLASIPLNVEENNVQDQAKEVKDTVGEDQAKVEQSLEGLKNDMKSFAALDRGDSRLTSPPVTEVVPSSPPEMPPSSFPVERGSSPGVSPSSPIRELTPLSDAEPVIATDGVPADIPDVSVNDSNGRISRRERPPRQQGSEEYEALTDLDKLNYCTTILLPESIRQILLWQNGIRTSFELLPPEVEQELYEKGEALLNEIEWVFNVKRLRQKAEEVLKRSGTGKRRAQPVDYRE